MSGLLTVFIDVLSRVLIIYLGVIAGYGFIKSPLAKFRQVFVDVTINLLIPLLIIASFLTIEISANLVFPIIGVIIVTIIGIIGPNILAKITCTPKPTPAEISVSTFPNALNFPFPIIYAFAPQGLGLASVFLVLTTIGRNTIGFIIADSKFDKESLKNMLLFPPIWGIIIGAILRFIFPVSAANVVAHPLIQVIFDIGIFATLMTVGFAIKKPDIRYKIPIFRVSIIRILVMGIIGFSTQLIFNLPVWVITPFIVQLMAPPAVINAIYAEKLGMDTELTSQIIVAITLLALLIVPFQLLLIELLV